MKIYISADMEGLATTTGWGDCESDKPGYALHARQMAAEAAAACEGAIKAGATEIYVKDAHDYGNNIDANLLPKCSKLIRNWSGHPYGMVEGIDSSFDACLFVGYHAAAGCAGNPLSHTLSPRAASIQINGLAASEFMLYSYVAALEGVPVVFLSGDRQICENAEELHPSIVTAAVKEGVGSSTISLQPQHACDLIREKAEAALSRDLRCLRMNLPDHFQVEIGYRDHFDAEKMSYFPGVKKLDTHRIAFSSNDYFEVKRLLSFVV